MTFRAAFFTGARFGLALAAVRFAAFARADLRALPRLAELPPFGSFPRFCTFDFFVRFAMIDPRCCSATIQPSTSPQEIKRELSTDRRFERDCPGHYASLVGLEVGRKPPSSSANPAAVCPRGWALVRIGDEGKAVGCVSPTALLLGALPLIGPLRTDERNFSADEC